MVTCLIAGQYSVLYALQFSRNLVSRAKPRGLWSTKNSNNYVSSSIQYAPVFDFSVAESNDIAKFDRIDDAIMGGISTSTLREVKSKPFVSWSGVCRIDGGGFCGFRTLPFRTPLNVTGSEGLFINCRLVSDDEPERRVWKMTVRSESGFRSEQVYQAGFELPRNIEDQEGWNSILVPFSNFQLVRGPRIVMGGPALDTSAGIFQVGLSMSKFKISPNATEIENFRAGYFNLEIEKIGTYSNDFSKEAIIQTVETETKEEMKKKQSLVFQILAPFFKFFFSEKAQRRKRAMKLLTEDRGMSRFQAIKVGSKIRTKNLPLAIIQTFGIISNDFVRFSFFNALKLFLFYPLVAVKRFTSLLLSWTGRIKQKRVKST